jgi:cytochrome c oxidase cbb3-type subunit III
MSSGFASALLIALAVTLAGCEREKRDYNAGPPSSAAAAKHDERDAYDVAQGEQLFQWMNCSGCHGHGGGGIGPALTDRYWIYGGSLQQIHDTIRDGRPNGMPAWRGKLTDTQMWQLAAYVRSMGRYVAKDVAPSRADAPQTGRSENRRPRTTPLEGQP